ncbi:UDP-glucose 4-epimerase family protein [Laribacter hongkongensis]|uniref:UDP-glucose 4-epimerase family protein n=1 Tax=Laribacter hongkongensis TaxID=168471 RepID=UPI001EFE5FF1|nr:SDR family oxidoreductase [Laribacter hongkongensis]MCG9081503.1 SDR family oxidoreductase [Laribacter hongkongensis]
MFSNSRVDSFVNTAKKNPSILVTGATGFIGDRLASCLSRRGDGTCVLATARYKPQNLIDNVSFFESGCLSRAIDWTPALRGVLSVVHCAARVHVMKDKSLNPLHEFRRVNVEGTANLAHQAARAGVRRFVYLSSIKVNGEFTEIGIPFTADDVPAPEDPYGVSKHEAEQVLRQIAVDTGMEVVIIRPPLVYGPSVKANFKSMMHWLSRGIPLPLAAVTQNRRSLIALDNLVDLIATCLDHPAAANQTFLVSDGEDLSTADLLRRLGVALNHPARLFYMPSSVLKLSAQVATKPGIYQRLCGSLQLDITKTCRLLGWSPPISVDEGLQRAAEGFRA